MDFILLFFSKFIKTCSFVFENFINLKPENTVEEILTTFVDYTSRRLL